MKKLSIFLIASLLFSCQNNTQDASIQTKNTQVVEIAQPTNTKEEKPQNTQTQDLKNEECAKKIQFNSAFDSEIYWAFYNSSDNKCWYLGYLGCEFFLTNEDPDEYYEATESNDVIKVTKENKEQFDWREWNKLYSDDVDWFFDFQDKISEKFFDWRLIEYLCFWQYAPDTLGRFMQAFQKYNITLPPTGALHIWKNLGDIRTETPATNPIQEKDEIDTTTSIEIRQLYNILYDLQQKKAQ